MNYTVIQDSTDSLGRLAPKGTELKPHTKYFSGDKDTKAFTQRYYKGYVEDLVADSENKWVVQFSAEDVENTPERFEEVSHE
jgi:hypothetical protein